MRDGVCVDFGPPNRLMAAGSELSLFLEDVQGMEGEEGEEEDKKGEEEEGGKSEEEKEVGLGRKLFRTNFEEKKHKCIAKET